MMTNDEGKRRRRTDRRAHKGATATALAVSVGVVASGMLVWNASYAAFTARTTNDGNTWATGRVVLDDSLRNARVMFDQTGLDDTASGAGCIQVEYLGTLAADVRLHADAATVDPAETELLDALQVTVTHGTGTIADDGGVATCSAFVAAPVDSLVYAGPLTGLVGGNSWRVGSEGDSRVYNFEWSIEPGASATQDEINALQDQEVNASFVWEATSVDLP